MKKYNMTLKKSIRVFFAVGTFMITFHLSYGATSLNDTHVENSENSLGDNFFENYTIKAEGELRKDVRNEYFKGVDFSSEELTDLRNFQVTIATGFLSSLDLTSLQIANFKTSVSQRSNITYSPRQLSVMVLTEKQFEALNLSSKQKKQLRISIFEDENSSPEKYKLSKSPEKLTSRDLAILGLSEEQFFQLKLSDEQLQAILPTEKQIEKIQGFEESKLSFEQFEQLNLTPRQLRGLVLDIYQLKKLQLLRFREFQPRLSAKQLEKLELTYAQVLQLDLTQEQIDQVKLTPVQVSTLGIEFIKSNSQSLYPAKFSKLQDSKFKLKDYQYAQLKLQSWQLQNIEFDQGQINTLRVNFKNFIYKLRTLKLVKKLYPIQFANLSLDTLQVSKITFNKIQIKEMLLSGNQLALAGAKRKAIKEYEEGVVSDELFDLILSALGKVSLSPEQLSRVQIESDQLKNVNFTNEQISKISAYYNKNVIRERLFEYLQTNSDYDKNANFLPEQLSDLELSSLQLALIEFDPYQLEKAGVKNSAYKEFKNAILGEQRYSVQGIEKKLSKITLDAGEVLDFYEQNGASLLEAPFPTNFTMVPYTAEQISSLGLSESEYLRAKSGVINARVNEKLEVSLPKVALSDIQKLEFNYRLRNISRKKLSPRQLLSLDLSDEKLKEVNLRSEEIAFYKKFVLQKTNIKAASLSSQNQEVLKRLLRIVPRTEQLIRIELHPNQYDSILLNKNQVVLVHYLSQNELLALEGDELEIYRIAREVDKKVSLRLGDKKTYEFDVGFLNQKQSLIDWKKLDPESFLNLSTWKKQNKEKEQDPHWKNMKKERGNVEVVGRVIDCIGKCVLFRGTSWNNLNSRSLIREKDEIFTGKSGHLYVELVDGTLVRISPNTSLIFNEVNIGRSRIMYYANLNWGNIVWLSRDKSLFKRNPQKETDQIFLPSSVIAANNKNEFQKDLFSDDSKVRQINLLNQKVEENNSVLGSRYSTVLLTFQGGYLFGDSPNFEVVSLLGNRNFILNMGIKNKKYWNNTIAKKLENIKVVMAKTKELSALEESVWYESNVLSGEMTTAEKTKVPLYFNQYLTTHIPTVLLAREIFFERYFKGVFSPRANAKILAKKFGYREWERENFQGIDDLSARINFLKQYLSKEREYQSDLLANYIEKIEKAGGKAALIQEHSLGFYAKSMEAVVRDSEKSENSEADRYILNSTSKPFWEVIHKYNFRQGKGLLFKN